MSLVHSAMTSSVVLRPRSVLHPCTQRDSDARRVQPSIGSSFSRRAESGSHSLPNEGFSGEAVVCAALQRYHCRGTVRSLMRGISCQLARLSQPLLHRHAERRSSCPVSVSFRNASTAPLQGGLHSASPCCSAGAFKESSCGLRHRQGPSSSTPRLLYPAGLAQVTRH